MPSDPLEPVSLVSANVGVAGAVASTVIAVGLLKAPLVVPETVWRTRTEPTA